MVVDISVQCYWIPHTKVSLAIKYMYVYTKICHGRGHMVIDISVQCYWIPHTKVSLAIKRKICIHQDLSWAWSYGN